MFTLCYDIEIGDYKVGMLEKVEIHSSVELLADTAVITLPGTQYNSALDVEGKIRRGDRVSIRLGYGETGLAEEFSGWDLDCNGIQAVVTLTDVSGKEIVEFLEQHLDFIRRPPTPVFQ